MRSFIVCALAAPSALLAAVTNDIGRVVLVDDAGNTRPAQSIATPAQVQTATDDSAAARASAEALQGVAASALSVAQDAAARSYLYRANYVVTSTVYVQSIGGVPYDPSNQVMRIHSIEVGATNISILATFAQQPLSAPLVDWRQSLDGGAWSNVVASALVADVPAGATNAVAAYAFSLPKPAGQSAFFRVVDNSTGASGSGLYWLVYGGIYVDGRRGLYGAVTNVCGAVTNVYQVRGGVVVEPDPL